MSTPAPDAVKRLVDRFDQNRDAYLSGSYNETQPRHEFLGPFFEALGWDVYNHQGSACKLGSQFMVHSSWNRSPEARNRFLILGFWFLVPRTKN